MLLDVNKIVRKKKTNTKRSFKHATLEGSMKYEE